jgi:Mrp family chromosome partitioning ATPase
MIQSIAAKRSRWQLDGPLVEHYRALADRLRHMQLAQGVQAIGVTSCTPRAGVSTVCANLAITAASMLDRPVLLVDANFVRPSLRRMFRLPPGPGLADVLLQAVTLSESICPLNEVNLSLLCAGTAVACTRGNYNPARVAKAFEATKRDFGLILVDLPVASATSTLWNFCGALDGMLLVLEAERSNAAIAQQVKRRLADAGARSLGVVLNKQRQHFPAWLRWN